MVVVIGAGIAGAATAYYLSRYDPNIVIVDAVGPAAGSSGKAGAFLAEAWGDGTKRETLHRKSFQMHLELAEELGLESFRMLPNNTFRVDIDAEDEVKGNEMPKEAAAMPWLSGVSLIEPIEGRAAQVDPAELTHALLKKAIDRGARLEVGMVDGFEFDDDEERVTAIRFNNGTHLHVPDDDNVVVALGPWSCRLEDWLQIPVPIEGVSSTSLLWENIDLDPPAALFCNEDWNGCHLEILPPRPNSKSLYVSGTGGSKQLSPSFLRGPDRPIPGDEIPSSLSVAAAQCSLEKLTIVDRPPDQIRACIRPVSPDGIPIVGKLLKTNVYVASGGGPWGITWGPLMGLMVASIIRGTDPPIRLGPLSPRRFDTMIYRMLMEQRGKEAWGIQKK